MKIPVSNAVIPVSNAMIPFFGAANFPAAKRLLARVLLASVALTMLTAPSSAQPPVLILGRTAEARYWKPGTDVLHVLVIGSDVREGDPTRGRADSIHVVSYNPQLERGTILGIPRDAYVDIPGVGTRKINDALTRGGGAKVAETVTQITGIPIHFWALTEFTNFRNLVDRLGGLQMNVPYNFADTAAGAVFPAGQRQMNANEVLAISRARKTIPGGDFGRSANQGLVMLAALTKFRAETNDPARLAVWLRAFGEFTQTNVGLGQLLELAALGREMNPDGLANVVAPGGGGMAGNASVVFLSPEASVLFANIRDDGVI